MNKGRNFIYEKSPLKVGTAKEKLLDVVAMERIMPNHL